MFSAPQPLLSDSLAENDGEKLGFNCSKRRVVQKRKWPECLFVCVEEATERAPTGGLEFLLEIAIRPEMEGGEART